jgi:Tol biopolymer transport system component
MSLRVTVGIAAIAVALAAALGLTAPAARAEFGPIELVSKSATEQAAEAVSPAISADGGFVVFSGRLGGRRGIFRKDLTTEAVALVVELNTEEEMLRANPSISGDGRYVAFTTKRRLDPEEDTNAGDADVYVADMNATPPTYEIASALDGCDPAESPTPCGLTYTEERGAVVAGRVAISEDGTRVAFLVRSGSDLAGPGTPAGQVAVRDLTSDRTYLMTTEEGSEEPVPGGGADPASAGAAISADGSTVAWVGSHLPGQVPMLADEEAEVRAKEEGVEPREPESTAYHEPLWRQVPTALDADPATRRVVGGGDPLAPGCPVGGTLAEPSCRGPFPEDLRTRLLEGSVASEGFGWGISVPDLSADGGTVAFVGTPDDDQDLFVVDMAPGLSRRQAVRRLTQWVNPLPGERNPIKLFETQYGSVDGPIAECAISPDGGRIAFTTVRQVFPLAPPTLVTPAPPGTSEVRELYQVNLEGGTMERATPGGGGAVSLATGASSSAGAASPSYSADGRLLAFASNAYNLVAGDTNGKSDAFVVETPPPASVEEVTISPKPATVVLRPLWRMTVSTASLPNGRVRLVVGVPGAGALRATAVARLGKRLHRHRVASGHDRASASGTQKLVLALPRKLRGLAHRKGGLYAQLDLGFEGPGGKPLSAALDVRFLVHRARPKGKR